MMTSVLLSSVNESRGSQSACRLGNCRGGSQLALIYCLILHLSEFLLDIMHRYRSVFHDHYCLLAKMHFFHFSLGV